MISRNSKEIGCPLWFVDNFPVGIGLDGELWMGRGTFENVTSVLKSIGQPEQWEKMKYMIFDLPHSQLPYEERITQLKKLSLPSHVILVESIKCRDNNHLLKMLNEVVSEGGEGLMLRRPQSLYEAGRKSNVLLKVKVPFHCCPITFFDPR